MYNLPYVSVIYSKHTVLTIYYLLLATSSGTKPSGGNIINLNNKNDYYNAMVVQNLLLMQRH